MATAHRVDRHRSCRLAVRQFARRVASARGTVARGDLGAILVVLAAVIDRVDVIKLGPLETTLGRSDEP